MSPQSKLTSSRRFTTLALSAALATLAACSSSSNKPPSGPTPGSAIGDLPSLQITIASITLADNCGPTKPSTEEAKSAAGARANPEREASDGDRKEDQDRAC